MAAVAACVPLATTSPAAPSVPAAAAGPVSAIAQGVNGRHYIEVNGQPFLPLVVQYAIDDHLVHDSDLPQADSYFADAKSLGFNTISLPIYWSWIEPAQGSFDWAWLDNFIETAAGQGLELELKWMGSNIAGGGMTDPSSPLALFPRWVASDQQTYVRHINSNQTVSTATCGFPTIISPSGQGTCSAFSLADQATLAAEHDAIAAMMSHIAAHGGQTVIGIQINNETMINAAICSSSNEVDRSYDAATTAAFDSSGLPANQGATFALQQLADYQNTLGAAVKQSSYSVYTRMNYWGFGCGASFPQVAQRAPDIDFEGYDPYTADLGQIRSLTATSPQYRGYGITENAATQSTTPALMLGTFDAGGMFYSLFSLVSGDGGVQVGLVNSDHTWSQDAPSINNLVTQLAKDTRDLATNQPGVDAAYFHVLDTNTSAGETKAVGGIDVGYSTSASGIGVALVNSDDLVLMGVQGPGTFRVFHALPASAQVGSFDATHTWVSQGSIRVTNNHDGSFSVAVSGSQVVRLHYANPVASFTAPMQQFSSTNGTTWSASGVGGFPVTGDASVVTGSGTTVYVSDATNHLQQLTPNGSGWTAIDLTNAAGGVSVVGTPVSDATGANVYVRDANERLLQFVPAGSSGWQANDLTAAGGVAVAGNPYPTTNSSGVVSVYVRDANNHLRQFLDSAGTWTAWDLTNMAGGVTVAGDPSVVTNANGVTSVFMRDTTDHLRQFQAGSGGSWTAYDLTGSAGGVTVAGDPYVVTNANGVTSAFVRDTTDHLRQFQAGSGGSWTAWDLTSFAGGVTVTGDPVVAPPSSSPTAVYVRDGNGHLTQFLAGPNGTWSTLDVTAAAGGVGAAGNPVLVVAAGTTSVYVRGS